MLNKLVKIENLTSVDIEQIMDDAFSYKNGTDNSKFEDKTVCLMFFENSTRTKISFEMAAKKLKMNVINFDTATSSINKGESLKETMENLYFIGVNGVIIRTSDDNSVQNLVDNVSYPIRFINAGSGKTSHPSQALLDYFTMKEKLGSVNGKKVVIIGDIEHSRVAKSNVALLKNFGAKITICSPKYFKPQIIPSGVEYVDDLKTAVKDADIVMGLRIQRERILKSYSEAEYIKNYRISSQLLNDYAPNAILMHPGPVNRDIEITSELLDGEKGKTILEQAQNGVFVRMALLKQIVGESI